MAFSAAYGEYATSKPIEETVLRILTYLTGTLVCPIQIQGMMAAQIVANIDDTYVDRGNPQVNDEYFVADLIQALAKKAGI